MSTPNFSQTVYDCAVACALARKKRKCKVYFGSYECNECRYDIRRYVQADPAHIDLFMLQAETKAKTIDFSFWMQLIILILIISALGACFSKCQYTSYKARQEREAYHQQRRVTTLRNDPQAPSNSQHIDISNTLGIVATYMIKQADVNNDGLSNCIDAAILFYQYFPDKSKVCILVNKNEAQHFHHMFNAVLIDGVWRAIEPQAYWKNHVDYFMRAVWGNQYDHTLNRDVTAEFSKFVR